ncbi:MAG: DUF192 domain-containing protein [Candidatus Marsarchaeota archaeon]|nr:DUF192 domain-containing protein [Candidatus Marsarchaeota archaeon]
MPLLKFLQKYMHYNKTKIYIEEKEITVLIADNFIKRMIGLMYKKSLNSDSGMLFIFNKPDYHSIWMLNMHFNIDILWIDNNFKIVDVCENAAPCTSMFNCKTYIPKSPDRYIIELNAGFIKNNRIKKGAKIKIKK